VLGDRYTNFGTTEPGRQRRRDRGVLPWRGRDHESRSGSIPPVLLRSARKRSGKIEAVKPGTNILHGEAVDVIPIAESRELVRVSGLPDDALMVVGNDHRLADPEPLKARLEMGERAVH
jgi:hypothetical protein